MCSFGVCKYTALPVQLSVLFFFSIVPLRRAKNESKKRVLVFAVCIVKSYVLAAHDPHAFLTSRSWEKVRFEFNCFFFSFNCVPFIRSFPPSVRSDFIAELVHVPYTESAPTAAAKTIWKTYNAWTKNWNPTRANKTRHRVWGKGKKWMKHSLIGYFSLCYHFMCVHLVASPLARSPHSYISDLRSSRRHTLCCGWCTYVYVLVCEGGSQPVQFGW